VQADEAGDEDGVGELDCAAEAGGWVDPGGVGRLGGCWGVLRVGCWGFFFTYIVVAW